MLGNAREYSALTFASLPVGMLRVSLTCRKRFGGDTNVEVLFIVYSTLSARPCDLHLDLGSSEFCTSEHFARSQFTAQFTRQH